MRKDWNKTELFEALNSARGKATNSDEWLAIDYAVKLVGREFRDLGPHEIICERIDGALRVDPPSVEDEPKF